MMFYHKPFLGYVAKRTEVVHDKLARLFLCRKRGHLFPHRRVSSSQLYSALDIQHSRAVKQNDLLLLDICLMLNESQRPISRV